ncbi:MAG: hypothetical protein K6T29_08205 [Peptococcaceae bacterium]|nr:hypothetical protein [Peptococcaceae bacterium]
MAFSSYDIQGPYHSFQHSFIFSKNSIVPVSVAQTQIFQPQGQVASCTISLDAPVVDENGNTHWVQCTATEADCVTAFNVAYQCATTLFNVAIKKLDAGCREKNCFSGPVVLK